MMNAKAVPEIERKLTSKEAHDLGMLIKDRTKVLKASAEEQAAAHMADFERKISATFQFDSDDVWRKVAEDAAIVIKKANAEIAKQALKKYGVPLEFAPALHLTWSERGANRTSSRRDELRRLAKAEVEAMKKAAMTNIEKQSLDLRTQVMSLQILSPNAKLFLESLAPVEEAITALDFASIEQKMKEAERQRLDRYRRHQIGYDPQS